MAASAPVRTGAPPANKVSAPRRRLRAALAAALLIVGCVLAPLGLAAGWGRAELTDTGRWTATTAPLAQRPAVQRALVGEATDGVMRRVNLDTWLDQVPATERPALRERFTRGIREFVATHLHQVVTSQSFPALWNTVNRDTHASLITSLSGPTARPVVLDLTPLIDLTRDHLERTLPTGANLVRQAHITGGTIELLSASEAEQARGPYAALRTLGRWLPAGAVVCLLAGLALAPRRRRALAGAGIGCAAGAALLLAGLAAARERSVAALSPELSHAATRAVFDTLAGTTRLSAWLLLAAGLAVAVLALIGPAIGRIRRRRAA